jgi:hypothetical protein
MNPDIHAEIAEWLRLRRRLKFHVIPFHISELVEALKTPRTPVSIRLVSKSVLSEGWTRMHTRRNGKQVSLYVPEGWQEAKTIAAAKTRHRPKQPIPHHWATIAAGLIRGGRVVVKGREEARSLTAALRAINARGEILRWKDGRCVVTHVGTPPNLLAICRCCRMGQCADCQHGYVRGQGYSPIRCECDHAEFLFHVGYPQRSRIPGPMRTRAKGTPPPSANKG